MNTSVKPHPAENPYPVLRPLHGHPLRFISLNREMIGLDTHYGDCGTYMCPGEEKCAACRRGEPKRWNGYLVGKSEVNDKIAICHITAAAGVQLDFHYEKPRGFMGARIILKRSGPAMNSPVEAMIYGWVDDVVPVTREKSVEIIARLYRKLINTKDGERFA